VKVGRGTGVAAPRMVHHGPVRTDIAVRTASEEDRGAILDLVRDAFSDDSRDGEEEVGIAMATWSLRAVPHDVVGVAPLAVSPGRQGIGIGTALMSELLRRAELADLPLVVVLGNPAYYGRFGFEPSGPLGVSYPPVGPGNPNFQVRRFSHYDPSYRGEFAYCWEMHHSRG